MFADYYAVGIMTPENVSTSKTSFASTNIKIAFDTVNHTTRSVDYG